MENNETQPEKIAGIPGIPGVIKITAPQVISAKKPKKALKILLYTIYFLLFIVIAGRLFFENQFNGALSSLSNLLSSDKSDTLVIGFSDPLINLNPLTNDSASRSRLLHIFEPLIRVSPDLGLVPGLAISYGSLNDLTWEFRLRPNVYFHTGDLLTQDDVIFSLNEAMRSASSEVKDLASTISDIKKIDDERFLITTHEPDPLLLSKLSYLLIFPKNIAAGREGTIGTGPYQLEKNENGNLTLKKFEKYWEFSSSAPDEVVLKTFASKEDKLLALKTGDTDIIANVPADSARQFDFDNYKLVTAPTLEVNFLMFNFDKIFADSRLREAVNLALNEEELAGLVFGFAKPVTQFIGNGIFGFDPTIKTLKNDSVRAKNLINQISPSEPIKATLDLPKNLNVLGTKIKEQLAKIGIEISLNFIEPGELGRRILARDTSDMFFFGWKTDLGDANDFLTAVVHASANTFGHFNGGNYKNSEVDSLIEETQNIVAPGKRLMKLREIMKIITERDIIGIPLFSPEVLYGVGNKIEWQPRVDGLILAQEVKM